MPGVIAAIQTFGTKINFHPRDFPCSRQGPGHGELLRVVCQCPSREGQKGQPGACPLRILDEELRRIPSKSWAEMIRKVYEIDPVICPQCGATMKVIAFLTDYAVVDRIINHLKLTFVAERPPPPRFAYQEVLDFLLPQQEKSKNRNLVFVFAQNLPNFPYFAPDNMLRKGYHIQNS
jgi:hypothetical protein